jgi:hypothetical protein
MPAPSQRHPGCLLREGSREARLALMLSHRANVASIVSRRRESTWLGDLIKRPIGTVQIHDLCFLAQPAE